MTNYTWDQGEDLRMQYIYVEGPDEDRLVAVDLSTGYSVRMDIVGLDKTRIYTFNSDDIADVDSVTDGSQPDNTTEATLSSGTGGTPNISILVPRAITLPGGDIYEVMTGTTGRWVFKYDIFLRNTVANEQHKIDTGTITIRESHTLWL